MCFYNNLSKLCETKGITISGLLSELNMSASNKQKWQKGATVNSAVLIKISDYFEVSVDYLLGRTDNPNVNGNIINTGNTGVVTGDYNNSSINSINSKEPKSNELDSTTLQIAKAFQDLDIFEKTEVMNLISKLSKK